MLLWQPVSSQFTVHGADQEITFYIHNLCSLCCYRQHYLNVTQLSWSLNLVLYCNNDISTLKVHQ